MLFMKERKKLWSFDKAINVLLEKKRFQDGEKYNSNLHSEFYLVNQAYERTAKLFIFRSGFRKKNP